MLVSDFDFELPAELVAQEPAPRGCARLLVLDRATGRVRDGSVADLPALMRRGDLLVVNNTRVFAARLLGRRVPSGGAVECMLLDRPDDGADAADRQESNLSETWLALVHPGQKLKPGARMRFEGPGGALMGEIVDRRFHGRRLVRLWSEGAGSVQDIVDAIGHVPLPPYIKRADTPGDRDRYQTVYARVRGSVAAPTAGLHFTEELLDEFAERGVERTEITLHVGYGTFKPVRTEVVEEHTVDPERYVIPPEAADAIARAKRDRRRVVVAGTTTTRALEDAARQGQGRIKPGGGVTSLFIYPGFRFQIVDALFTNFHLPKSSLLMLVAAFGGREQVLSAYQEAVARGYRFYSYGDAMFIQ